jgi:hypothetical protein
MTWLAIFVAFLALVLGVWIGLGAPGWPHKNPAGGRRRRLEKRPINPIAWGRRDSDRRARRGR